MSLQFGLYIIPTPIGNLKDITLRALEVLETVDIIYCEDTRISQKLLSNYGIKKPLRIYNDHVTQNDRDKLLELAKTNAIALISDAGTPLICDPGYKLIQQAREQSIYYTVLPGSCAVITGLIASSLAVDSFSFLGFFNPKKVEYYQSIPTALIFYESPHNLLDTLLSFDAYFKDREISVCRELTKFYEEVIKDTPQNLYNHFSSLDKVRGEFVLVVSPAPLKEIDSSSIKEALIQALKHSKGKDAVQFVMDQFNIPKKAVYQIYISLQNNSSD